MKGVRVLLVLIYTICFAVMIVFNFFATRPDGKFFRNFTGGVADKYKTLITPIGWTFSIWGLIYIWLLFILLYMYATFCRSNGTKTVYEEAAVTHPFFLICMSANFLLNAAWLFVWDRELIQVASGILWLMTLCSVSAGIFNLKKLYSQGFDLNLYKPSELWLNRLIVQNGLALYCTWTIIASIVNTVVAIQYPPDGFPAADPKMAAIIAIGSLFGIFVLWFPIEIWGFDKFCRYTVMQYAVVPFAMGGIYARRATIGVEELDYLILAFLATGLGMLCIKFLLLICRTKNKPLFPPIRP